LGQRRRCSKRGDWEEKKKKKWPSSRYAGFKHTKEIRGDIRKSPIGVRTGPDSQKSAVKRKFFSSNEKHHKGERKGKLAVASSSERRKGAGGGAEALLNQKRKNDQGSEPVENNNEGPSRPGKKGKEPCNAGEKVSGRKRHLEFLQNPEGIDYNNGSLGPQKIGADREKGQGEEKET